MSALESQLLDRDTQCKSLVRELAIRDDPSLAYVAFDTTTELKEADPITDRLLLFKSLPALQEQNGKLLKIVRALQAKLSDRETKRATAEDDGVALDQAAETITTLHTKLVERQNVITDLQAKITEVTRERDVFSRLLSRGEGLRWPNGSVSNNGPLEHGQDSSAEAISSLQTELDLVRKKAEEDVAEAKNLAREKSEAAGNAEVERAKAEAKATMLAEQHRLLTETHDHQKKEYATLESQLRQLQSQMAEVQVARRKVCCILKLILTLRPSRKSPTTKPPRRSSATRLRSCVPSASSGRAHSRASRPTLPLSSRNAPTSSTLSTTSRASTRRADAHEPRRLPDWRRGSRSCSARRKSKDV